MKHLMAIIIITLFAITPAKATAKTGLEMLEAFEESEEMRGLMLLYLMGITDGILVSQGLFSEDVSICPPDKSTNKQMSLIVEKYLKENPSELHKPVEVIAVYALLEAYSCEE